MSQPDVLIVEAWNKALGDKGNAAVWYFGNDYAEFLALSENTANSTMAPVGQSVNAIAARIRAEFAEIDSKLATGRFALSYAISDIAERNPLSSDFYLNVCRAIALVEGTRLGGKHVVVTNDPSLGRSLAKICRMAGISAVWEGAAPSLLRFAMRGLRTHAAAAVAWLREQHAVKKAFKGKTLTSEAPIRLMTWLDPNGIGRSGEPFHGNLPAWLKAEGISFAWIGNPMRWMGPPDALATAAANSEQCVVPVGAYQGITSLLRAVGVLIAFPFSVRFRLSLGTVDVSPLLRRAILQTSESARLLNAAIMAGVAAGMVRKGLAPAALVYTFENQPWEKSLLWGFRRYLPQTMTIGVQTAPFAENYIGVDPSCRQWSEGNAPDLIVTNGSEFRDRLIAAGAPADRVVVGGSLRFPELLQPRDGAQATSSTTTILASCPMDPREAFELAYKAAAAVSGMDNVILRINFHPKVNAAFKSAVIQYVQEHFDADFIEFVDGDAGRWLKATHILLYSSSGAVFDAAASGVPAIFVGSDLTLDLDKMAGHSGLSGRSVDEVRTCIQDVVRDSSLRERSVESMREYLRRSFAELKRDFWLSLARRALNGKAQ